MCKNCSKWQGKACVKFKPALMKTLLPDKTYHVVQVIVHNFDV
jgi:hypothetical protein